MMRQFLTILLLFNTALCFAADPSKGGRLPDGRAFRVDSQGNQLVDYIAELEMNVDALNRRVQGLEYELEQKQAELQRVSTGKAAAPQSVKERDLLASEDPFSCPACPQKICPEVDCSPLLKQSAETANAQERARQELISQVQGDLEIEKRMHALELDQLRTQIGELESKLAQHKGDLDAKSGMLLARDREIEKLKQETARKEIQTGEARAQFSAVKMRALDSVRGSLLTEFNQVRGLLHSRANLLEHQKKSGNVVSFRPNPALSGEGESLDDIKRRITLAQSVLELNQVRRPLNQIRGKLNEDLGLLKRISR